jgi:hypothetical protein
MNNEQRKAMFADIERKKKEKEMKLKQTKKLRDVIE